MTGAPRRGVDDNGGVSDNQETPQDQRAPIEPTGDRDADDAPEREDDEDEGGIHASMFSGSPAKVMRIGTMVKQLLDEVRSAPLDAAARTRLVEMHERSLRELEDGLSEDLVDELRRITLPFADDAEPSDAELRIAQAQLVGWLEGLFHGLQTALVAQQMQTQAQLAQMRRALPPGGLQHGLVVRQAQGREESSERAPGQYL